MSAEIYFQTMETIAATLPDVPGASVESQMQAFQMFMGLCGEPYRDRAAALLEDAARRCLDDDRKNMLSAAAKLIASGWPIAETPEVPRATAEDWEAMKQADPSLAGPRLLHLTPWDMFPGLAVRIGTTFTARGDTFSEGEILHFRKLDFLPYHEGYTFHFDERTLYLGGLEPDDAPVLANCGNQYFEPYPTLECLRNACKLVHQQWNAADRTELEAYRSIREELIRCDRWLKNPEGPPPYCMMSTAALESFENAEGPDEGLGFKIAFLFIGIANVSERT